MSRARADRIGLAIGASEMRAVGLRRGRVAWAIAQPLDCTSPSDDAVRTLLARGAVRRWPAARVTVAVGPTRARTKRLTGIPGTLDARILDRVVRESAPRFFLGSASQLAPSRIHRTASGDTLGAAIEAAVIEAVERACRARHLRLDAVVPTVAVLARVCRAGQAVWSDGETSLALTFANGRLEGIRRAEPMDADIDERGTDVPFAAPPQLSGLGNDAARFVDAYAAALATRSEPLAYRPEDMGVHRHVVPGWRLAIPATLAAAFACMAILAPGLLAERSQRIAARRIASVGEQRRASVIAQTELLKVTESLGEVARFDGSRREPTTLLASLARALPDGSAMTALRIDSTGAITTVLAPSAAAVLRRLDGVAGIGAAEVLGPVTRELIERRPLERVTVRFRLEADSMRAMTEESR